MNRGGPTPSLTQLLGRALRVLRDHPRATRAVIGAFAAEGRRFAATPEGRVWKAALSASPELHRVRVVWDAFGLGRHTGAETELAPMDWLRLASAIRSAPDLEASLSRLLVNEAGRGG